MQRAARTACGQRLGRGRSKNRTFGRIEGRFGGGGIAGSGGHVFMRCYAFEIAYLRLCAVLFTAERCTLQSLS